MSKLRVHDMAGEFGISTDEVINLLRQMDVPVRSHLSLLTDDQVARVRARWEREKRARAEKPTPAASGRRRKGAAVAEVAVAAPAPPTTPSGVADTPGVVRRRRRVADQAEGGEEHGFETADYPAVTTPEAETPAPAAPAADATPAPVAAEAPIVADASVEREGQAAAAEPPAAAPEREVAPTVAAEPAAPPAAPRPAAPRPAAPRPAAPPVAPTTATPTTATPTTATPTPTAVPAAPSSPRPMAPPLRPAASASPGAPARPGMDRPVAAGGAPAGPRPRPIAPGPPRPRPVGGLNMPPRPVASAAPGAGLPPRRDGYSAGGGVGAGGAGAGGGAGVGGAARDRGGRGKKKGRRGGVDQEAVTQNISKTMSAMRGAGGRRGRGAYVDREAREEIEAQRVAAVEREKKTVRVNEFITVSELAQTLKIPATQIVSFAFKNLGLMVTINQRLDFDQIELIAGEFGFQAVREEEFQVETSVQEEDQPEDLDTRPPVVTIMGHVDHGKTSLLDYVRKANVVAGESGGITQHIGAYHVSLPDDRAITFLDTPGHEAFTAMRARGAQVTDVVVLVVAADDQVMPQTVEAISHARNAGVPIIVAINKVDLPTADAMKVKQDLLQHNVVVEDFGGDVLSQEISAKTGKGVPELLEKVLLQSDLLELKANADRRASGTVVEAQLDPGKGPVATILVQNGTLKVGDDFICGVHSGRVRALLDERGKPAKAAGPAIPVQVLGLTGVPMAGDQLVVVEDAAEAREIAQRRERLEREARSRRTTKGAVTLEDFMSQAAAGSTRQLKILIKADQGGPAEALADALQQLSTGEVQVEVVQRGVGAISESDILLAKAAGAIIIGFHVRPDNKARAAAEREGVEIKLYRIIYEAVSDVRAALEGLLRPEEREVVMAEVEVREIFKVPRIGTVAGCFVRSGTATRTARVRVVRDGVEVYEGTIASLRRFKDDVREVREGFECGIGIENFNDVKVGDILEFYRTEEVARTLASSAQQQA